MRLIDADTFKQWIAEYVRENNIVPEKADLLCEAIDKQPTAYSVDKVVEQLKKARDKECAGSVPKIRMCDAIKIVKAGVVK